MMLNKLLMKSTGIQSAFGERCFADNTVELHYLPPPLAFQMLKLVVSVEGIFSLCIIEKISPGGDHIPNMFFVAVFACFVL